MTTTPKLHEQAEHILQRIKAIASNPKVAADPRCNHSTTVATNLIRAVVRDLKDKNL